MARISFAKDASSALKGAGAALVVTTAGAFKKTRLPKIFSPKVQRLLGEIGRKTKPGESGQVVSTQTGSNPARLSVGVLPGAGSRYLAPSRPDALNRLLSGANLAGEKKAVVVFILGDDAHLLPSLGALARAFPAYRRKTDGPTTRIQVVVYDSNHELVKVSPEAREHFKCVHEAARLVDTAPSDMNPAALAGEAQQMLDGLPNVTLETYVGEELADKGLGGIYAVGKAAAVAPRMLVATYTPENPSGKHVALVGKGVTFDTGGLHIKPRGSMETMKCDMGGAAAVLGAFRAIATNQSTNHTVSLVMCMAENAIGPGSYKPDDIIEMHSGKTVEINNTDAEGRLLLGDGVSWASRVLKANFVIDAATLTGAQMIATGANHAAVMSNDADLEALAVQAGYSSGDTVHPLPWAPELYKQEFKSQVADMKNSVKNRANAQSSCAAQFVHNHLGGSRVKWLHIDLAGPSFRNERGTGYGVALMSDLVSRL